MGYFLFNLLQSEAAQGRSAELATAAVRAGLWGVRPDERGREALAAGDRVLIYLGAPDRVFVGAAELASAVHDWALEEASRYPGRSPAGVSLAHVEEWDPPVPVDAVLEEIGPSDEARADFDAGVVRITAHEHEAALAVAARR